MCIFVHAGKRSRDRQCSSTTTNGFARSSPPRCCQPAHRRFVHLCAWSQARPGLGSARPQVHNRLRLLYLATKMASFRNPGSKGPPLGSPPLHCAILCGPRLAGSYASFASAHNTVPEEVKSPERIPRPVAGGRRDRGGQVVESLTGLVMSQMIPGDMW